MTTTFTKPQVTRWRNAIFVVFMLPGVAMATWASRLPATQDALDASPAVVGWLLFGIAAGAIAGIAASSPVIARFGARAVLAWGLVATAGGLALGMAGASMGSFAITFAGMVVFGAASGFTDVGMNVSGAANEQALQRSIMPIFHAFFSFGTMLGAGLGVLAEALDVPIWLHGGIIAVVILAAIGVAVRFVQLEPKATDHAGEHIRSTFKSRLSILIHPRTVLIGLVVLGAAFTEGSANDWIAIAAVDGHGVDKSTGAIVLGLFVTAMTVGRLGGVVLINRFGRVPVLRGIVPARGHRPADLHLRADPVGRVRGGRALGARGRARVPDGNVGGRRRPGHGRRSRERRRGDRLLRLPRRAAGDRLRRRPDRGAPRTARGARAGHHRLARVGRRCANRRRARRRTPPPTR